MSRLDLSQLPRLADGGRVRVPAIDPASLAVGIAHLGIGAFHRAHQAVYTEDAMAATGELGWGIVGVTQRSSAVRDQLHSQDCLYTVVERGALAATPRIVGAVGDVVSNVDDFENVADRLADPRVRVITLTVTEKGYRRNAQGGLDLADPVVRADLAGAPPRSVIGQLAAGLAQRRRTHQLPVTVLCCDNLPANGEVLRHLVLEFCAATPDVGDWIAESVRFPSCMVDRIVPATTDADRQQVADLLGVRDDAAVVAEPFMQWVIQDSFAAGRPAWETAGALFTADVKPYETMKLRLLNATHSLLAYLGALAGYETIAQAVTDPLLAAAASALMSTDAAPTLRVPDGLDITAYQRSVLDRFANPALRHRTTQVASDGSQKLPIRLLGTARDRLAAGAQPHWVAVAVAGWLLYAAHGADRHGRPLPLDDPLAPHLRTTLAPAAHTPSALVDAGLTIHEVFPPELAADTTFRALLIDAVEQLAGQLGLRLR